MITSETCYEGITADGKMILTPAFKRSIAAFYQSRGEAIPSICREPGHARAMDSAPDDLPDNPDRAARYKAMEDAYAALLHKPCGQYDAPLTNLDIQKHAAETQKYGDSLMRTRTTQDQVSAIQRNKRAQIMDGLPDEKSKYYYLLEQAYKELREVAGVLFVICLLAGMARAQVQPVAIFGGSPPLGGTCQFAPNGPMAFLTPAGKVISCAVVAGSTTGFWTLSNGLFQTTLPQGSPVAMNGSDQTLFSVPLPPLPASKCYNVSFDISALSNATVKWQVDGTAVQTLVSGATLSGGLSLSGIGYCNGYETQTAQLVFGRDNLPTAVVPYWAGTFSPANNINWSSGHVLALTVNQPSGTITPISFSIQEGI